MKLTRNRGVFGSIAAGVMLAMSASGAMADWNFKPLNAVNSDGTATITDAGVTVTASAYSVDNATSNTNGQTIGQFNAGQAFAAATLTAWQNSGLGVASGGESGSPNHAIDNKDRTDVVLFGFSKSVRLDALTIGWSQNGNYDCSTAQVSASCAGDVNPDVSLLYYTGKSAAPIVTGLSWTALIADGWKLVSSYADLTVGIAKTVNAGKVSSSWWMVSAYNTGFGSSISGATSGDDYFKLASLAGVVAPTQVPEPGSLALMGVALAGLLGARRRMAKR